jgi:RNA polymerase sigma-70 factor (ECF subfamily)
MEDQQIVDLYFARSESAITETDRKYGRYCHSIAYNILEDHEDAKEIVNDTYLKAWNTIPPNRPDPLKPYVGMISRHLSLDRYEEYHTQKRGGQVPLVLEELAECIPDNDSREDIGESVALKDALARFIRSLPDKTQMIFLRRYWYASSVTEIAKEYGMRENSVNVLLHRTRKKLKDHLQKEGFDL